MEKLIEIKNRFTGEIIISGKYASIKKALEKNRGANLREADLVGANLREADLVGANLREADLAGANLREAKLVRADLREANLVGAKLVRADLVGAKLVGAKLPRTDIVINDRYLIHIRPEIIRIGCEIHPISWFKKLTIKQAEKLYSAGEWWKNWKPVVLAIHEIIKDRKL